MCSQDTKTPNFVINSFFYVEKLGKERGFQIVGIVADMALHVFALACWAMRSSSMRSNIGADGGVILIFLMAKEV